MCGENGKTRSRVTSFLGSPPRVRGKLDEKPDGEFKFRITPACAGKTVLTMVLRELGEDHPRVCGENNRSRNQLGTIKGSPPRVRGKPALSGFLTGSMRITPACAGKTLRKWRISVVDPSPQPRSSLTSRRADASIGSQRAPCAAPV